MIIGNISLSSRPREDEMRSDCICLSCFSKCDEVPVDDSFDDQFGNVESWSIGSSCCGAEVAEGKIYCDKSKIHVAKKDHVKRNKVIIANGQKYRARLERGYYVDPDTGKHNGIFNYSKRVLDK